uniref:Suppression of tumorigenicity 7 n=1 Tax=Periophthalmus magnuspinnatus TaxID=409849 RepID=A0A3B3ZED1_9GOBI
MFGTESSLSMFLNTLTPKFYVALTGTSSLISGLILIFEWWYFRKYGTSFIEQVSVSHLRPLLGGVDTAAPNNNNSSTNSNGETDSSRQSVSECKVWRNPLNLFRGAEYNRYTWVTGREPLTYYDMNLSAQDHQTFFTCDSDHLRPADAIMQKAWRERNPQARISAAHEALELEDCATAYILLAEEEATTIMEAERLFKQALKAGELCYRRSQTLQHHGTQYEAQHIRLISASLFEIFHGPVLIFSAKAVRHVNTHTNTQHRVMTSLGCGSFGCAGVSTGHRTLHNHD